MWYIHMDSAAEAHGNSPIDYGNPTQSAMQTNFILLEEIVG